MRDGRAKFKHDKQEKENINDIEPDESENKSKDM